MSENEKFFSVKALIISTWTRFWHTIISRPRSLNLFMRVHNNKVNADHAKIAWLLDKLHQIDSDARSKLGRLVFTCWSTFYPTFGEWLSKWRWWILIFYPLFHEFISDCSRRGFFRSFHEAEQKQLRTPKLFWIMQNARKNYFQPTCSIAATELAVNLVNIRAAAFRFECVRLSHRNLWMKITTR